ncbi:MAG: Crp/Fnr family transcriptional regulator [Lysobacterales bacterium]
MSTSAPLDAQRLLQDYPALNALPASTLQPMLNSGRWLQVPAGTVLFDERQPCEGFPLVLSGRVRVVKSAANGRELPLYRVTPGETCILSTSCLLAGEPYQARGVAECDCELMLLPVALFEPLLAEPVFRRFVFHLFAERLTELMTLIEAVAFHRLGARLAGCLLGKGPVLQLTHQQLADELGSVREMVSRLLKGFAGQGLVQLGREQIRILDAAGLRQIANR